MILQHLFSILIMGPWAISEPSLQGHHKPETDRRVVCNSFSGGNKLEVEDIDPFLCTHISYSSSQIDPQTYEIQSLFPYNDLFENDGKGAYMRLIKLVEKNPQLKCILNIFLDTFFDVYSTVINNVTQRTSLVKSVVPFLKKYGFHGLDVDWVMDLSTGHCPKDNFVTLLKELKATFEPEGLILSLTAQAAKATIDACYDIPEIVKYVDFINLVAYDLRETPLYFTALRAPLYAHPLDTDEEKMQNVNFSIHYWIEKGCPPSKLNLGITTAGYKFHLLNPDNHGLNASAQLRDYPSQAEICQIMKQEGWTVVRDPYYKMPYAYKGNEWIAYEDVSSITDKCKLVNQLGLVGVTLDPIDYDDFQQVCGTKRFPLLSVFSECIKGTGT